MHVKVDGRSVFKDSVGAGTYARSKIKLERIPIGFHTVEIESKLGGASFSKNFFILFNRTMIFEYFKGSQAVDMPYFRSQTMMRNFYPD